MQVKTNFRICLISFARSIQFLVNGFFLVGLTLFQLHSTDAFAQNSQKKAAPAGKSELVEPAPTTDGKSDGKTDTKNYAENGSQKTGRPTLPDLDLQKVPFWGASLGPVWGSLQNLKNKLNDEEFLIYSDFYSRVSDVVNLLTKEGGTDSHLSPKVLGHVAVALSAFTELLDTQEYKEDLTANLTDKRRELLKAFTSKCEKMLQEMVAAGHLEFVGGRYRVVLANGEAIVRSLSEPLIKISDKISSNTNNKSLKEQLQWFKEMTIAIRDLKGGDGSERVNELTIAMIDQYDLLSLPGIAMFTSIMQDFERISKMQTSRKSEFQELAGYVNQFIGIMTTVKVHKGYGVDFNNRTSEELAIEKYPGTENAAKRAKFLGQEKSRLP